MTTGGGGNEGETSGARVLTHDQAAAAIARWRAAGQTIVFTNGVFDILHPGHIRYLRAARAEGDRLLVAVNSDQSTRAIKGAGRPVNPESERAETLAALDMVDAVVVFDEPDPHQIITRLQPDVLAKGADWAADRIIGRDVVEARGGRVVRVPVVSGRSTSGILERARR